MTEYSLMYRHPFYAWSHDEEYWMELTDKHDFHATDDEEALEETERFIKEHADWGGSPERYITFSPGVILINTPISLARIVKSWP